MKHSNVFYKFFNGRYEPVKEAKLVRNALGLDLFRIKCDLFEGKTGGLLGTHSNREAMLIALANIKADNDSLRRLNERIEHCIKENGISPRYSKPDEHYEDIFHSKPSAEKSILAPSLDGHKHYFVADCEVNGITLYSQKSQKAEPSRELYLHYDGWMISLGGVYRRDVIIEDLSKGIPNCRQIMMNEMEKSLADPDKWADLGFANFLGCAEEANKHNRVIREKREAERETERKERARQEEEQRHREQVEYEAAILNAEQAILQKQVVHNTEIRGKSLLLQLFNHNNVDIPLRTKGWVNSSLVRIFYDKTNDGWSFSFRGRQSTAFYDCLHHLVEAVERKFETTVI